jgi:hypothetical protein
MLFFTNIEKSILKFICKYEYKGILTKTHGTGTKTDTLDHWYRIEDL